MMRKIRKFAGLQGGDRLLLLKSWMIVAWIRLALRLVKLQPLRLILERRAKRLKGRHRRRSLDSDRLVWAVATASRYVPGERICLPRALALHYLLVGNGHPAEVCFGVTRDRRQQFRAHAWVESDGKVLTGEAALKHFTPLEPA